MVCAEHSENHSALVRLEELRVARKGKIRSRLSMATHRGVCDRAGNSAQTCSEPLPCPPGPHCQHWRHKQQGFFTFYFALCLSLLSIAGHNTCCIQNLLQIQEGNKPQSLWMFGNQSPEEKHCLWLNLHYSIKRKHTKSLLNEETVWVRTTFTKIRKWIAAVEGWATA